MAPMQHKQCTGVAGSCQQVYLRNFIHHAVYTASYLVGPSVIRTSGLIRILPRDRASEGSAKLHTSKFNFNKHSHPSQRRF